MSKQGRFQAWLASRRLARFHRRCDRLGIPGDVRRRMVRAATKTGKKLKAPDWYAGRTNERDRP